MAATETPARAPFAQAAALVDTDGSLLQAKGIKAVTRPTTGIYCITFKDDRLTPDKLIVQATLIAAGDSTNPTSGTPRGSTILVRTHPFADCGNDPAAITVATMNEANDLFDLPFFVTVA
ncbi:hypothetical protein AB0I00_41195 [Streptomyces sp. NPDC050803]|uniref:hypothetical protein n=1 Tax=unclassified Streptomyces TaxID=2593676 RepID=UPI0034346A6C